MGYEKLVDRQSSDLLSDTESRGELKV